MYKFVPAWTPPTLGVSLREKRQSQGKSQKQLAKELGIDNTYLNKIENSKCTTKMSPRLINSISEYLKVSPQTVQTCLGVLPKEKEILLAKLDRESSCFHSLIIKMGRDVKFREHIYYQLNKPENKYDSEYEEIFDSL